MFLWLETLETQKITRAIEKTRESERCSPTSIQLVQLPTHSHILGVSMVIKTGDSERAWTADMEDTADTMEVADTVETRDPEQIYR